MLPCNNFYIVINIPNYFVIINSHSWKLWLLLANSTAAVTNTIQARKPLQLQDLLPAKELNKRLVF